MSSDNITIRVDNLSKCYQIYDRPHDRLKQSILPKLRSLFGRKPASYFREFWALKQVSFEVSRGETIGIIGRNGSGKSTLLQMICGTLAPTSGIVQTTGRVAALLELGAGFNPEFTGRENVYMNAAVLGLTQKEISVRFDDIAAFADIGDFIEQPVKHYSSGMYARLAFAIAINVDPDILVVDEALAVGDEPFQRKCFARIEEIKHRGGTILFVSHSAGSIISLCDKAILLDCGKRLFTGEPKKAIAWYQKLTNANDRQQQQILEEIRQVDTSQMFVEKGEKASITPPSQSKGLEDTEIEEDGYDVNFISKSMVIYEANGAVISNIRLSTVNNHDVNQLINRRRYRVSYDVKFLTDCGGVGCFFAIKTVNGTMLGGGQWPRKNDVRINRTAGSVLSICFEFECNLLGDIYFINCGVIKSDGSLAHRILDALVFRVIPSDKVFSSGIVDFHVAVESKETLIGEVY